MASSSSGMARKTERAAARAKATASRRVDIDRRFDTLDANMASVANSLQQFREEVRFAVAELRLDMQARFEHVDRRVEQVDGRFEQVDRRFVRLERHIVALKDTLDRVYVEHGQQLTDLEAHFTPNVS
jgi:chromosome segregation ATPase